MGKSCDAEIHIILAETVLHLIFAVAISRSHLNNEKIVIVWFGEEHVRDKYTFLFKGLTADFISLSNPQNSPFFSLHLCVAEITGKISHLRKYSCSLTTYYDTAYGFEIIRDYLQIGWEHVAILEDGQANYFRNVAMPSVSRRMVKNCVNMITGRFPINTSRYNLGGNAKIKTIFTMSPEHVFMVNPYTTRAYSMVSEVRQVLEAIEVDLKNIALDKVDGVITLSPVYAYGRRTKKQLLEFLHNTCERNGLGRVLIKPHPRDLCHGVQEDIERAFGTSVELSPNLPTEFLFKYLPPTKWFGPPSSSSLNRHFLYPHYQDEFLISAFGTASQFLDEQIICFRNILDQKLISAELT